MLIYLLRSPGALSPELDTVVWVVSLVLVLLYPFRFGCSSRTSVGESVLCMGTFSDVRRSARFVLQDDAFLTVM